jgi:hypothetical protein
MAYIVKYERKNAKAHSVALPSKERVREYAKNTPFGNSASKFDLYDTETKKSRKISKSGLKIFGKY